MSEKLKRFYRKCGVPLFCVIIIVCRNILHKKIFHREMEEVFKPVIEINNEKTQSCEEIKEVDTELFSWETSKTVSILTQEEDKSLQAEAMAAAEKCSEYYKNSIILNPNIDFPCDDFFNYEERKEVVDLLGQHGYVSISENMNMENYKNVEDFYSAYSSGVDAMVTVYEVYRDGNILALTFIHRNGKIQCHYVSLGWLENGIPVLKSSGVNNLKEIKLTQKGYFIYTYADIVAHGNLKEYFRIKPLSNECRKLTEKYVSDLSFVNYNMLVTNWDSTNVEKILMPRMFEDIYRIYSGENFRTENGYISAETYETVMTTCLPVSVEQLRTDGRYDVNKKSYEYEMIFSRQFPPFGEVVDYRENMDGTITLFVDGVWPDYGSDRAFTNCIVIQPLENGKFRYLSNSIESGEMEIPIVE